MMDAKEQPRTGLPFLDVTVSRGFRPGQLVDLRALSGQLNRPPVRLLQMLVPEVKALASVGPAGSRVARCRENQTRFPSSYSISVARLNPRGDWSGSTRLAHEASIIVNELGEVVKNRWGRDRVHVLSLTESEGARQACAAWAKILKEKVQTSVPG